MCKIFYIQKRKYKMPTQERKKEIEKIVNQLMEKDKELELPAFDIVKFLKEKENFAIASQTMVDDTTGMLFVDDEEFVPDTNTHRLIVINSRLNEQPNYIPRRRFIIAHEYGHLILHKKASKQYAHRDTSQREAPMEKEADFFARCLLMPKKIVDILLDIDLVKDFSYENKIALISRIFNVTKKKATERLKDDLGYNG